MRPLTESSRELDTESTARSYAYDVFLSYSHAADGKLAPALQRALERFGKPWYRLRSLRTFRDKTGLAVTEALWPAIERAVERSAHFVLLASPASAASEWVTRELRAWRNRNSKPLVVLTAGEVCWCPETRDFDWQKTTALSRACFENWFNDEPLFVDLRTAKGVDQLALRYPEFQDAVVSLVSHVRGVEKEDVASEAVRQHRIMMRLVWSAVLVLIALAAGTSITGFKAYRSARELLVKNRDLKAANDREHELRTAAEDAAFLTKVDSLAQQDPLQGALLLSELRGKPEPVGGLQLAARLADQSFAKLGFWRSTSLAFGGKGDRVLSVRSDAVALVPISGRAPALRWSPPSTLKSPAIVRVAELSSDGRYVAIGMDDGSVQFWNVDGSPPRAPIPAYRSRRVSGLKFVAGDAGLLIAHEDGGITYEQLLDTAKYVSLDTADVYYRNIYSIQTDKLRRVFMVSGETSFEPSSAGLIWSSPTARPVVIKGAGAKLNPDGESVLVPEGRSCSLRSIRTLGLIRAWTCPAGSGWFDQDGTRLLLVNEMGQIAIVDVRKNGEPKWSRRAYGSIGSAIFQGKPPDQHVILSVSRSDERGTIYAVSATDLEQATVLEPKAGRFPRLEASSDGHHIVASSAMDQYGGRLWDLSSAGTAHRTWNVGNRIERLMVDHDGTTVLAYSRDGVVIVHPNQPQAVVALPDSRYVRAIAMKRHGTAVVKVGWTGEPRLVELPSLTSRQFDDVCEVEDGSELAFSDDETKVALPCKDGVRVWRSDGSEKLALLPSADKGSPIRDVRFSPDSKTLVGIGSLGMKVWRGLQSTPIAVDFTGEFLKTSASLSHFTISADGSAVVLGASRGVCQVWDAATNARVSILGHHSSINDLDLSARDERVLSVSEDGSAQVSNAKSGALLRALVGHGREVVAGRFHPANKDVVVTGAKDGAVRFWRLDRNEPPIVWSCDDEAITALAFDASGSQIFAATSGGHVCRWMTPAWASLLNRLRSSTLACLGTETRTAWLGETDEKAQAAFDTCARAFGR